MLGRKTISHHRLPALATVAVCLMLAQCDREPVEPTPADPAPDAPAPSPVITSPAALTRAELLTAVSRAASAYVSGQVAEGSDPLVGRTFAIRMPFGCTGPSPAGAAGNGVAGWAWGPDHKTIQLTLTPGDWLNTALVSSAAAGSDWEAVEGFWIARPWLSTETCPTVRADALQSGEVAPSPETVGLAAVFKADESRVGRRNGRAYAFTVRADGDTPLTAPADGYRAVVEGRLTAFPGGRAIRCRASSPDQRPVCIVAIQMDRVAFTTAKGDVLSEWRPA